MSHWEKPFSKPPPPPSDPKLVICPYPQAPSANVEMTAYALLAYTSGGEADAVNKGLPIVKWLSKQRNAYGGFSSTQVNTATAFTANIRTNCLCCVYKNWI